MAPSAPQSHASMLASITTDLDKIAPRFEVQPEQIEILRTPSEFYETLKVGSTSRALPQCILICNFTSCQIHAYPLSLLSIISLCWHMY